MSTRWIQTRGANSKSMHENDHLRLSYKNCGYDRDPDDNTVTVRNMMAVDGGDNSECKGFKQGTDKGNDNLKLGFKHDFH